MTFERPPLPYDYDALEPVIDAETMRIHHGKHHQAYTDNLNKAVDADAKLAGQSIEAILAGVSTQPPAVRNNAGGFWNHTFFWNSMVRGGSEPHTLLAEAIDRDFGSLDGLKEQFSAAGLAQFGSGWVWLISDDSGHLSVVSTPNQDNPLMDVVQQRGTPLLANDVWEHAYYLTYRNNRANYLKTWWQVVEWEAVSGRYQAVTLRANRAEPRLDM